MKDVEIIEPAEPGRKPPRIPSPATAVNQGEGQARRFLLIGLILLIGFFVGQRILALYLDYLWFDSLHYAAVFTTTLKLKCGLFIGFALATLVLIRTPFWLLERASHLERIQTSFEINGQPVAFSPRFPLRTTAWLVAGVMSIYFGFSMASDWSQYALLFHQSPTSAMDPIFGRQVGYYLFTLPLQVQWAEWLWTLSGIVFIGTCLVASLVASQTSPVPPAVLRGVSLSFGVFLAAWAWDVYLSRFTLLLADHTVLSGITYTDAHIRVPGLLAVTIAMGIGTLLAFLNALGSGKLRLLVLGAGLPLVVYVVTGLLIPSYVTNFIVRPNELAKETPFITHNIQATRAALKLDDIEEQTYEVEFSPEALSLQGENLTLNNIQLWDWRALQATLKQIQEIRTYYDFPDIDIDRYVINGKLRHVLLAARELDINKLPVSSRNWINEKLIYTHGYGATMNPVTQFTPEGMPNLVLANMPVESKAPELKVTRPEIYYGELTNSTVYVKTKQKEFHYPQGETNEATVYEGQGGIRIGSGLRRFCLSLQLGDITRLPFSEDITADSLVLIRRNISERAHSLAPYLSLDEDPYLVIGEDGKLYWMIDAYTTSANYPYARHFAFNGDATPVNYVRNSIKIVIDAYEGSTSFFVAEPQDPIIQAYSRAFPALYQPLEAMPEYLKLHIRFPERMMEVQAAAYSLYHMDNPQVFYNREDLWNVATELRPGKDGKQAALTMEPHFALMQLPGEPDLEFISMLPFTPSNRNNLIAWIAGRSDREHYGKMLVYRFPKTKLVDGPQQIEARIDQNAFLSGQLTLWNQQGSSVIRGQMVVVPIGKSLLYAEPIYLQAANSPMPELRVVVLASQEHLGYGTNFDEALRSLAKSLGTSIDTGPGVAPPTTPPTTGEPPSQSREALIEQASQNLEDYQKLMAAGKFGEAGQKLEALKQTLGELRKK